MNGVSVEQLLNERQNKFIENRTIIEREVDTFLRSVETMDPVYQQQLNVVVGQTARDLLPSLWVEPFNEAQYNAERASLDAYIKRVTDVCDKLNAEALRCLQE